MVLAVWIRLGRYLSFTGALDDIEKELNNLGDIAEFINTSYLDVMGTIDPCGI